MASVEHFEIPVDDIARAQTFYREALGFAYEPWGEEMGLLTSPSGSGISGDLHVRGAVPHPTVVFTVDRIEDALELVTAHGGETFMEIQPLTGSSRWVYVRDSEGNVIGLYDEVPADA